MPRHSLLLALAAALALPVVLHGCATSPSDAEVTAKAAATMKSSFKEQGQAKLDRLDQDDTQDRKSTRLNSSHSAKSRMPSSA